MCFLACVWLCNIRCNAGSLLQESSVQLSILAFERSFAAAGSKLSIVDMIDT